MRGAMITRGGTFNATMSPASYWGQRDPLVPTYPQRRKVGFRWTGPYGQPGANNMLIGFGNDAAPYWQAPPAVPVGGRESGMVVVPAQMWGREGGPFFNPVRRCGVSEANYMAIKRMGVTPRGGIFDGEAVGGPTCTFGQPPPQPVPMRRPTPLSVVPVQAPPMAAVPFAKPAPLNPFEGFGAGPDGIGRCGC